MKNLFMSLVAVFGIMFVTSSAGADPTRGSFSDTDTLRPGQTAAYSVVLNSNETTRFAVFGDGDGDIDCGVYDEFGHLIAQDTDTTDSCLIDVVPRWRGTFHIRLVNSGQVTSLYTIRVF